MSHSSLDDSCVAKAAIRKITWRLVPFLALIYFIAWIDRVNVSFAALQMNRDLHLSPVAFGFGAGVFFLSYGALEIPSNIFLARVGARRWLARIMISWGLISIATLFVRGPLSFYALRLLLGAAEAGCFPGILYYLGTWFPRAERSRAMARFTISIPIASVLGGPVAGMLLSLNGVLGLAGWQWLFLLEGAPAILLGVLVLQYLPDSPSTAEWLGANERAALSEQLRREADDGRLHRGLRVRGALTNPVVWALGCSFALVNTGSFGLQFWLPEMLKSLSNRSDLVVGLLAALPYLLAPFAMLFIAARADKTGRHCLHAAASCFVSALGFLVAASTQSPPLAIGGLAIAAAGIYGRHGPFWTLPTLFLDGPAAAAGIAVITTFGAIGGFLGPYSVGLAKMVTGSFAGALTFLAFAVLAGGVVLILLRRNPALVRHDAVARLSPS